MIETVHTITPIRNPPTEHQTTRDRLERARALVIAQFGETVLVDLEPARRGSKVLPSRSR